jgi:hypothetical protein
MQRAITRALARKFERFGPRGVNIRLWTPVPSITSRRTGSKRRDDLHADANWCNKNDRWGHGNVL